MESDKILSKYYEEQLDRYDDILLEIFDSDSKTDITKYLGERGDKELSKEFQTTLNKIFNDEIEKIIDGTEKFSKEEMREFTKKVTQDAVAKMKLASDKHIEDIYKLGSDYVAKQIGQRIDFTKVDMAALKAITDRKVLWEAYADMGKSLSSRLNKIITQAYKKPKEFSITAMVNKMKGEADVETYRLNRIVRTETQAASMKGREVSFKKLDPEGKYLYKWAVRFDERTSPVCKEIHKKIEEIGKGKGVSLKQLNKILKDTSLKHNGKKWQYRDFVVHPNCRSGLVRVV